MLLGIASSPRSARRILGAALTSMLGLWCSKQSTPSASVDLSDAGNPDHQPAALECIAPFVAKRCAVAECHDSATREHAMDLSTGESIYDAWVNRNGLDHCENRLEPRVVPGNPDGSFVMRKLTGQLACAGSLSQPMPPPPELPLLPEQIEAVRIWIASGAPRECTATVGAGGGLGMDGGMGGTAGGGQNGGGTGGSGSSGMTSTGDGGEGGVDDYWSCTASKSCESGLLCVGRSCGETTWNCASHGFMPGVGGEGGEPAVAEHACPSETAFYCGCDGTTFEALRSCPDRPFQHPGACDDGFNCDPQDSVCDTPEPTCPEGQVPSVPDECFGECVPLSSCRCDYAWECPDGHVCGADQRCELAPADGGT